MSDPRFKTAYSMYFARYIMCVKYNADDDWYFVFIDAYNQPCSKIYKAKSKYSSFIWK